MTFPQTSSTQVRAGLCLDLCMNSSVYVLEHDNSKSADQKLLHLHKLLEASELRLDVLCAESTYTCLMHACFSLLFFAC